MPLELSAKTNLEQSRKLTMWWPVLWGIQLDIHGSFNRCRNILNRSIVHECFNHAFLPASSDFQIAGEGDELLIRKPTVLANAIRFKRNWTRRNTGGREYNGGGWSSSGC